MFATLKDFMLATLGAGIDKNGLQDGISLSMIQSRRPIFYQILVVGALLLAHEYDEDNI